MGSGSVLTLQVKEGEHAAARQRMDHGGTMKIYEVYNDKDKIFNDAIYNKLVAAQDDLEMNTDEESRTELDSHANMAVIGRHAYILAETGKTIHSPQPTSISRHLVWMLPCNMTIPKMGKAISLW